MEFWEQTWRVVAEALHDHAVKILTGLLLTGVGWYFGFRRALSAWKRRDFLDRLNVSLTYLDGNVLRIRTLMEKSCDDVFLNSLATQRIKAAAKKTTLADPILPLPKEDCWYYLNAVLNDISELFANGLLRAEQGAPVTKVKYLCCLTSECAGEVRTRKIRAMLVRKSWLLSLSEDPPEFDHPNHHVRWDTLKVMATEYARNPHRFIELELCT